MLMKPYKLSGDNIWFTSDTHWAHKNVIQFCNRPFSTIEEHDAKLIENWNSVVQKDDIVFHLGDFCFGGSSVWKYYRECLNGRIVLIKGNHDLKNLQESNIRLFEAVLPQLYINIDGRNVYLNHFPFLCFAHDNVEAYKDSYSIQAFGHIHTRSNMTGYDAYRTNYLYPTQYDVGVDNNNYFPISWKELDSKIKEQIKDYYEQRDNRSI